MGGSITYNTEFKNESIIFCLSLNTKMALSLVRVDGERNVKIYIQAGNWNVPVST